MRDFGLSSFDLASFDPVRKRRRRPTPAATAPGPSATEQPVMPDSEVAELRKAVAVLTGRLEEMQRADVKTRDEVVSLARRVEVIRQAEIFTPPLVLIGHRSR